MRLTPTERDRLLLFSAAELARRRRAAGVLLNVPEATALIADEVCEVARRGGRHADAVRTGQSVLTAAEVLPEVPYIVRTVSVEAVFTDGSRLVVVPTPFGQVPDREDMPGTVIPAGSALSRTDAQDHDARDHDARDHDARDHDARDHDARERGARDLVTVEVVNTASVVISVTSHFHFFEANARLRFSRATAYGRHLDVPAGTHVRFEPGTPTSVVLAPIRGGRVVVGFAGLVDGPLDHPGIREKALSRARHWGFLDSDHPEDGVPENAAARATAAARAVIR